MAENLGMDHKERPSPKTDHALYSSENQNKHSTLIISYIF